MHKKYYFAMAFILIGIATGILSFAGLSEAGFNNRGHVPIVVLFGVSAAFIVGGLLFVIFGGAGNK